MESQFRTYITTDSDYAGFKQKMEQHTVHEVLRVLHRLYRQLQPLYPAGSNEPPRDKLITQI